MHSSTLRWSLFGEAEILTVMFATSPAGSPVKGREKNALRAPAFLNGGTCSISSTWPFAPAGEQPSSGFLSVCVRLGGRVSCSALYSHAVSLSLALMRPNGPSVTQYLLTLPTSSCSVSFLLQLISSIPEAQPAVSSC